MHNPNCYLDSICPQQPKETIVEDPVREILQDQLALVHPAIRDTGDYIRELKDQLEEATRRMERLVQRRDAIRKALA